MGKKRIKGQGVLHDEVKTAVTLRLTPTAKDLLKQASETEGVSQSELVEQWLRSLTPLNKGDKIK